MDDQGTNRASGSGMRFRKLRIAWSVWWGVVCLLLCVLWVRSYWQVALILCKFHNGALIVVLSQPGVIGLAIAHEETVEPWTIFKAPTAAWLKSGGAKQLERTRGGFLARNEAILTPYWFWFLITAALAGTPWLRLRFSLRTLLIATTLVAVGLGLIVYLAR
jgi:hypothetical protein